MASTRNDTDSPVIAPTATSSTRSIAESSGLPWFMVGSSSTMMAVTVATFRLGLMAATNASGATASTSTASSGTLTAMRDQHRDGGAIDRAAQGPDQIVAGRLQRPADAHLGDDDRGQNRPQRQLEPKGEGDREGAHGGDGDADTKAKFDLSRLQPGGDTFETCVHSAPIREALRMPVIEDFG